MPWNTQGGPWQGGGRGPWGGRPPGGGGQPPDLEELLRRSQEKLKGMVSGRGGRGGRGIILIAVLVVLALWLASGFYRVLPEEQGVVLRFGRLDRVTGPGLHYHLPSPIETVIKPQVARVNRIEVGFRSTATGKREIPEEALMLTGDENIIDIHFVVLWRISNAPDFLFNIREPEKTLKAAAESVMREIIGRTPILEATTEGRRAIEQQAQEQLQNLMNEYGAGILLSAVQLQKADPPPPVIAAFKDVQAAQADRERMQNEAEAYANDVIPRARGEAERIIQEAEAYKQEVVARATGEASRFKAVLAAYRESKDVTLQRIYLETMQEVLAGVNKVIIDSSKGASNVIPYLPLPALQQGAEPKQGAASSRGASQ